MLPLPRARLHSRAAASSPSRRIRAAATSCSPMPPLIYPRRRLERPGACGTPPQPPRLRLSADVAAPIGRRAGAQGEAAKAPSVRPRTPDCRTPCPRISPSLLMPPPPRTTPVTTSIGARVVAAQGRRGPSARATVVGDRRAYRIRLFKLDHALVGAPRSRGQDARGGRWACEIKLKVTALVEIKPGGRPSPEIEESLARAGHGFPKSSVLASSEVISPVFDKAQPSSSGCTPPAYRE